MNSKTSDFPWRMGLVFLAVTLGSTVALACSVPVFRYALEHWGADAYEVLVFHDQDLSPEHSNLLQQLQLSQTPSSNANVRVRAVDLRQPAADDDVLSWRQRLTGELPQMAVVTPRLREGAARMVGGADWSPESVDALLMSPIREELAQRLVAGHVVWVLLTSGDTDKSTEIQTIVDREIAHLQQTLKLPAIDPADMKDLAVKPEELKIKFSSLTVKRDDATEQWLVDMLLATESDLRDPDYADADILFPVFGRGRVLHAMVAKGINPATIKEAAEFLIGACQCEVKADNPGVDLVMAFDWQEHIVPTRPEEVVIPLVGLGGFNEAAGPGLPGSPQTADTRVTRLGQPVIDPELQADANAGIPPIEPDLEVKVDGVQADPVVDEMGGPVNLPVGRMDPLEIGKDNAKETLQPTVAGLSVMTWGIMGVMALVVFIAGFLLLRN